MRFLAIVVVAALAAGCQTPSFSLNVQRSLLRDGGDSGITFYLETVDKVKLADTQTKIGEACDAMETFLKTGQAAVLPLSEVEKQLKRVVPAKYHRIVSTAIAAISAVNVDVSKKIGVNNVKRIRAAVVGIRTGTTRYDVADRNPDPPVTSAPDPGLGTAAAGGGTG